jgi:tetratricopeptide (TPR) repeat protein
MGVSSPRIVPVNRRAISVGIGVIAIAAAVVAVASRPTEVTAKDTTPMPTETEVRDADIEFWSKRADEDPHSAADRSRLALLLLQRGRETGNFEDFERAEAVARQSLALREAHNGATYSILASALLARHEFTGALAAAKELMAIDPEDPGHVALLAEIQLELGDYEAVKAHIPALRRTGNRPTVAARYARILELTGQLDAAERVLHGTIGRLKTVDPTPEQRAWFDYRLGEIALKRGRLDRADSLFHAGLATFPSDYRILGALGRLELARKQWRRAIDFGGSAIAIQLDPATLGAMSEAYAQLGDSVRAKEFAQAMRTSALSQPGPIHRAWGLFLLDHDQEISTVLAKALGELTTRRDVYGYDLVAWALHKSGRDDEARTMMAKALAQGTEDATLSFHAGMIERALGNDAEARTHLQRALAINPTFHHLHADAARAALGLPTVATR